LGCGKVAASIFGFFMNYHFHHLNTMTGSVLVRALREAKEGKKDLGRDWYRFIFQSGILDILKADGRDVSAMQVNMKLLNDYCHPDSHPVLKPELEAIHDSLQNIEKNISNFVLRQTAARAEPFNFAGSKN